MRPPELPEPASADLPIAPRAAISRRSILRGMVAGGTGLRSRPAALLPAAASAPDRASTLTVATNFAPSDLDPHSAYDAGSGVLLQGPFEGLIRLRPNTTETYDPVLAESWSANADHSVWTFSIRRGVTFQDGALVDAEAVRASYERLLRLGLAGSSVLGRFIERTDQIVAADKHTVVFDLGRPQPRFEAAMASSYGTAVVNVAALKQHEVEGDWGHAWAQSSGVGLGTGPYRIVEFDLQSGAVLERFDGYWRGWEGDHFHGVVLRVVVEPETRRLLIEQGDADIATTLPLAIVRELESNTQLMVDRRFNLAVRYVAMTVAGRLESAEARQALCWAFPYEDVVNGVYAGYAKRAFGPVAELCHGFDRGTFVYDTDLDRARVLLARAGVSTVEPLTMMLAPGNREVSAMAELFQANLAAIGLGLDIREVDFPTYVGIFTSDTGGDERPHLLPSFWQPDYNDGWSHLWPQVSCEAWQSGNGGHYCHQRVEALLERARDAADESTYHASLAEVQQIVTHDDPAAIYYAQPEWLTVLRRDIDGFAPNLVVGEIIDFYALSRRTSASSQSSRALRASSWRGWSSSL